MHVVGRHLQTQAKTCNDNDRDAYARSAYNRYYYACFLALRHAFIQMDPAWGRTAHKSYPETLEGVVNKRLKTGYKRAEKIGDSEATEAIRAAQRAISELTKTFREAYGVRVVADYDQGARVLFSDSNTFSLNSIPIDDAYKWESTVITLSRVIVHAWKIIDD